jgi:exonuclease SbcD
VYSGSMERIDFGEEKDPKGFCWVELERGATRWQFVPVNARPFITLKIDVRNAEDPTQKVLDKLSYHDLEEAVVRVIITADVESEAKLRDTVIHEALRNAKVSTVAAVQKDVERPARMRLGASPEGLTSMELLTRYFQSKNISDDRIALLLEKAEKFIVVDG